MTLLDASGVSDAGIKWIIEDMNPRYALLREEAGSLDLNCSTIEQGEAFQSYCAKMSEAAFRAILALEMDLWKERSGEAPVLNLPKLEKTLSDVGLTLGDIVVD